MDKVNLSIELCLIQINDPLLMLGVKVQNLKKS
jgi:hypothetical protein